jgi:hypothetical protein
MHFSLILEMGVSKKFPSIDPLSQPGLPSGRTDALLATHLIPQWYTDIEGRNDPASPKPPQSTKERKYSEQKLVVRHGMRPLGIRWPTTQVERDLTSV